MKKVIVIALSILILIAIGIFSVNTHNIETDITKNKTKAIIFNCKSNTYKLLKNYLALLP